MKYCQSSFPYLAILALLIVGIPFANHQMQKQQQLEVVIELPGADEIPLAQSKQVQEITLFITPAK